MRTAAATETPARDSLPVRVSRLAGLLAGEGFPPADRAALKRYAPGEPPPLAFYRLWLRYIDDDLADEAQTPAWALIVWGLARMGAQAHRPDRPLGRALADAQFSEARLERLLAAADGVREELFASMVRLMAAKVEGFDWRDAALLLLTRDPEKRERIHRRIAADYYRHLPKTDNKD